MALEPRSSQTGLRDKGGPGSTPPDSSDNLRKLDLLQELTPPPSRELTLNYLEGGGQDSKRTETDVLEVPQWGAAQAVPRTPRQ